MTTIGQRSPSAIRVLTICSVGVGKSSKTVCHRSWAGPTFQRCPCASAPSSGLATVAAVRH
jgi:hypothetical protein